MNNFEHIDDYLTNRLNAEDKASFEKQLESDGALRADVEFQKLTIEAIKSARVAELKTMLNNVPVGGGISGGMTAAKIAGGVITVALISGITYFALRQDATTTDTTITKTEVVTPVQPENTPAEIKSSDTTVTSIAPVEKSKITTETPAQPSQEKESKDQTQPQPAAAYKEPKIEVLDLSGELTTEKKEKPLIDNRKPEVAPSRIEVSTDSSNKKYAFHYQFSKGKLMLYGSFDKGLYEILEINGNSHNVFLFYEGNYYLLEEKDNVTSPLEPVKDPVLLKKLKEYRTR